MVVLPDGTFGAGVRVCRRWLSIPLLFFVAVAPGVAQVNSWTKPTSGYWEEQTYWSLGTIPNSSQSVVFTNAGWKALAIGAGTVQSYPDSMTIQGLQIASPQDSYNVLLMNFSGFEVPLQTTSLTVGTNSTVVVQGSALRTGSVNLAGTFYHGDFSQVTVQGLLSIGVYTGNGVYYLTNGTLSVSSGEYVGSFSGYGRFVQYGGSHSVDSIHVGIQGEFDVYDGETIATNGIAVGGGDYAQNSTFHQYGGDVSGDMVINGRYYLDSGSITGHMSLIRPGDYQRTDAYVVQTGGTNLAASLYMGTPNRYGGRAFYTLSNGVLRVESSVPFNGGQFSQYNGQVSIKSTLSMQGRDVGLGIVQADYYLGGGTLAVAGVTEQGAHFQQDNGTNIIGGDLVLNGVPPPQHSAPSTASYTLAGGFLFAQDILVDARYYDGFRQTGGACQIAEKLSVSGTNFSGCFYYTLQGGTLTVKDIYVGPGAFFQHTGGNIIQSGGLTLDQGEWRATPGTQALGSLQLTATQDTNAAAISFPDGSSILRLADSSSQPWLSSANLCISNWHGSAFGGGASQLYFGSDSRALTPQQLAQIRFVVSGNTYPAAILATGEVVPVGTGSIAYTRNGDTLTLTWAQNWTLQSSTNVTGPYQDVPGTTNTYTAPMNLPRQFFRLRQ